MARDKHYWERVRFAAKQLDSDGCTGVPDIYLDCCYEHDVAYRTGTDVDGNQITRAEADEQLRRCIQEHSLLGMFSPLSWLRWAGTRLFAGSSWRGK